jgi:predicted Fe-Mo cluster-binding NifX family protein
VSTPVATDTGTAAAFTADGGTRSERWRAWWAKHKFWLLAALAFVVVTAAGLALSLGGGRSGGPLDIANPAPTGGQAAAAVLRNHGVDVAATDSLEATLSALKANGQGSSTVLLYDPTSLLKPAQASRLAEAAIAGDAKIVAIAPGPLTASALSKEISSAGVARAGQTSVQAYCTNPDAVAAGSIGATGLAGLSASGSDAAYVYRGTESCFKAAGAPSGLLAVDASGAVSVLGNAAVVSNNNLSNQGNAALAFRLLGSREHLIWYTASLKDVPVAAEPPSLAALTPQWIFPASAWLLLVGAVGMLWRGRRDGPLVAEPLPVIVKASETVTGRARLYQDAKAVDTAARTLRHATLTRLAQQLRLGTAARPEAVVEAVAAHTGKARQQLGELLLGADPMNEKQLLSMAAELAALEEEVAQR